MREQQDGKVEQRYGHVRHHPVFGSGRSADGGSGRFAGRGAAGQPVRRPGGWPGPVRPTVVPVSSRPGRGFEPWRAGSWRTAARRAGRPLDARWVAGPARSVVGGVTRGRSPVGGAPRVLVRRPVPTVDARTARVRRLVAGVVLVVAAALVVVALGLLADGVAAARRPPGVVPAAGSSSGAAVAGVATGADRLVVVGAAGDVWELAEQVAPGEGPAERAALVGRIVAANALPSWQLHAGQVLRVPSG